MILKKKKFDSKVGEKDKLTSIERPLNGVVNLENYEEVEQKKKIAGKNFVIQLNQSFKIMNKNDSY